MINDFILAVKFTGNTAVSITGKLFDNGFYPDNEFCIIPGTVF
jgi:hypothetical protein